MTIIEGTRVIRKNYKGVVGVVVAINSTRARVRWEGSLRPFRGGTSDNHTTGAIAQLLEATEGNLEKRNASNLRRKVKWAKERYRECKNWQYCPKCKTRFDSDGRYDCYRCGHQDWGTSFSWKDCNTGKEVIKILKLVGFTDW